MPSVDLRLHICGRKAALGSTLFLWSSLKQRLYEERKKKITERQMTVAHPNIHSAAVSEQFYRL